jgi:hypothetical protein
MWMTLQFTFANDRNPSRDSSCFLRTPFLYTSPQTTPPLNLCSTTLQFFIAVQQLIGFLVSALSLAPHLPSSTSRAHGV